jgi:hypothetical protein
MVGSSLVRPAMGSLLAVFAYTTTTLIDAIPKTSVGGFLGREMLIVVDYI